MLLSTKQTSIQVLAQVQYNNKTYQLTINYNQLKKTSINKQFEFMLKHLRYQNKQPKKPPPLSILHSLITLITHTRNISKLNEQYSITLQQAQIKFAKRSYQGHDCKMSPENFPSLLLFKYHKYQQSQKNITHKRLYQYSIPYYIFYSINSTNNLGQNLNLGQISKFENSPKWRIFSKRYLHKIIYRQILDLGNNNYGLRQA
eukprot:TRINITY_DN2332_c0_g1_i1.p2 TRINITY_DN2332_c0_g1~~TRINITY_DN2332_c0_g1_i1.p2  ORF type:complete len:202 (+),score=-13.68 TRINITY_DN2332_c0_g1_i1:210-815(+)